MSLNQSLLLVSAWLAYFALHSLLASRGCKGWVQRRLPELITSYRLLFNILALVLLVPPITLLYLWRGEPLWQWQGLGWWLMNGAALTALLLFVWSLRFYDSGEFLGLRQLGEQRSGIGDREPLCISPLHRYVRHPWYSLGLVLIWTQPMDWALLLSAICATFYFVIGSRWEEQKLIAQHGESYRWYLQRVPGLIPLPWRRLSPEQANRLAAMAEETRPEGRVERG